ncbi:MAG: hypothetical protein IJM50_00995 [Lachnospiraceae bacterium]|nr:hypothetical protein [Lachnospiraceae bacterium]
MSWKCDVCDSYNEDSARICYVCGQARSDAALREARRREKEAYLLAKRKRAERFRQLIGEKLNWTADLLFYAGLAVSISAIAIISIIRIVRGDFSDAGDMLNAYLGRARINIGFFVELGFPSKWLRLLRRAESNFASLWNGGLLTAMKAGEANFKILGETITGFASRADASLRFLGQVIHEFYNSIIASF